VSVPVSVSVRPKATGTDPQQSTEKRTTVERRGRSILGSGALSKATREAPVRAEPHPTRSFASRIEADSLPTGTDTSTDTDFPCLWRNEA
jgi:hypothetical protein